jgi:hypothetical protein
MLLSVFFGRTELGAVHPLAVTTTRDEEPIIILMAGRSWRVVDVDWPRRRVSVVAAEEEGRARWMGNGRPASFAVCRAAEAVVAGAALGCGLSRRATSKLEELQEQLPFVDGTRIPIVHSGQDISCIWTFAGGLTNAALAQVIPGTRARSDDFCIRIKAGSEKSAIDAFSRWDAGSFRDGRRYCRPDYKIQQQPVFHQDEGRRGCKGAGTKITVLSKWAINGLWGRFFPPRPPVHRAGTVLRVKTQSRLRR